MFVQLQPRATKVIAMSKRENKHIYMYEIYVLQVLEKGLEGQKETFHEKLTGLYDIDASFWRATND